MGEEGEGRAPEGGTSSGPGSESNGWVGEVAENGGKGKDAELEQDNENEGYLRGLRKLLSIKFGYTPEVINAKMKEHNNDFHAIEQEYEAQSGGSHSEL